MTEAKKPNADLDWAMRVFETPHMEDPHISQVQEDRWNMYLAGQNLVAEIRRLQSTMADPGTGISKELFEMVCEERDALLAERADAPIVMGYKDGVTWHALELCERADDFTHTARLVDIQKIGNEEKP